MHNQDPTKSEVTQASTEALAEARDALASAFHEDWRKTRLQEDGSFAPREKQTSDEAWIANHGVDTVDIANTAYEDLPLDWQQENRDAADVVVGILLEYDGFVPLNREEERNRVGDIVHHAWLERNDWAQGGDLDKPFWMLPVEEQDKDIHQINLGMQLWAQHTLAGKADKPVDYGEGPTAVIGQMLDVVRQDARTQEIVRTAQQPERQSVPLTPEQLTDEARQMIDRLYGAVQRWGKEPKVSFAGEKSYQRYDLSLSELKGDSDPTQVTILFGSSMGSVGTPELAQVTVYYFETPEAGWPRETFVDLHTGEDPRVSIVDYPYHQEDLSNTDLNTDAAVSQAKLTIETVPGIE